MERSRSSKTSNEKSVNSNKKKKPRKIKPDRIENYIQIQTDIFKLSYHPLKEGGHELKLKKWKYSSLRRQFSYEEIKKIKMYDGYWNEPNNIDFQQEIFSELGQPYFNKYKPPIHEPRAGEWSNIEKYLRHIFCERYELFLDYMHVMYVHPKQKLPAICLLRREKGSGKSTLLGLLEAIYYENSARVNRNTFMGQFNGDWSESQVCLMDEAKFETDSEMNRLKYLITEDMFMTELKGYERYPTPFYGKFFFTSNHERDFIKVDADDDRFWVEKVNLLPTGEKDPNFLAKMKKEIPEFLFDIIHRKLKHGKEDRLFFARHRYITKAFLTLVNSSRSNLENELSTAIISLMDDGGFDAFCATPSDLEEYVGRIPKSSRTAIRRILKNEWGLTPADNVHHYKRKFRSTRGEVLEEDSKGRYYRFEKSFFEKHFDDLMI